MLKKVQSMLLFQEKNYLKEKKDGNQKKSTLETELFGSMHKQLDLHT